MPTCAYKVHRGEDRPAEQVTVELASLPASVARWRAQLAAAEGCDASNVRLMHVCVWCVAYVFAKCVLPRHRSPAEANVYMNVEVHLARGTRCCGLGRPTGTLVRAGADDVCSEPGGVLPQHPASHCVQLPQTA